MIIETINRHVNKQITHLYRPTHGLNCRHAIQREIQVKWWHYHWFYQLFKLKGMAKDTLLYDWSACLLTIWEFQNQRFWVKSVQSALSDLLTTSATHGTFSCPSTKHGLISIGLELNTNARESFEHCWLYSLNLSIDQHVCQFIS